MGATTDWEVFIVKLALGTAFAILCVALLRRAWLIWRKGKD
jgi:hypothetical protein